MTISVVEGTISWETGLALNDLPDRLPTAVRIHAKAGKLGIEPQGVVGAIPLPNGETLQILPKIGTLNFLRLLFRADGRQDDLNREFDEFVTLGVDENTNVAWIVARAFLVSSAEVLRRSPNVCRVKTAAVGEFAVGQLDFAATAMRMASKLSKPVVYAQKVRSSDTPENRLILRGLERAWQLLANHDRDRFSAVLQRWRSVAKSRPLLPSDLTGIQRRFAMGWYGGPRDYYRRCLMLALVVLGVSGVDLSGGSPIEGDAVLLNSADVFERFVRNVVAEGCVDLGWVVQRGSEQPYSLYTDGSVQLRPDIVISRAGNISLIADVKYKAEATADDHYQLNTYLTAHGVRRGMLVLPEFSSPDVVIKTLTTSGKLEVKEVRLPMKDLAVTEVFLSRLHEGLK